MTAVAGAEPARATQQGDGVIAVSGALTFDTVPRLYREAAEWFQQPGGPIAVDLQAVTRADSAGLALLLEWLRLARMKGRAVTFANTPEQVRSLIRVNGLERALGMEGRQ